jgi:hypothetical protein
LRSCAARMSHASRRRRKACSLACCNSTGEHEVDDEGICGIPLELREHVLGVGTCGGGAGEIHDEDSCACSPECRRSDREGKTVRDACVGRQGTTRSLDSKPQRSRAEHSSGMPARSELPRDCERGQDVPAPVPGRKQEAHRARQDASEAARVTALH